MRALSVVVLAIILASVPLAAPCGFDTNILPQVPPGSTQLLQLEGKGTQNYTCIGNGASTHGPSQHALEHLFSHGSAFEG